MNISETVINLINEKQVVNPKLTFLCVGTDKIRGDSIGPIVGSNLQRYVKTKNVKNINVIGDLNKNLNNINISQFTKNESIIIAVDSAISNSYDVGNIIIDKRPIKIRQALYDSKKINCDINIKCIVGKNFEDKNKNFLMLKNVKSSIVLNLAEKISTNLYDVIENYSL